MEDFISDIETMVFELIRTYHYISDEQKKIFAPIQETLGICPKCGGTVSRGKYGAYCTNKCGMNIGRAMGAVLNDAQIRNLLEGKRILVKGLKGKTGKSYDAYLIPEGIEDFAYSKDGKEVSGSQYRFKMEFPQKKK